MSFFRYYKDKQDADGESLWWPGGPDGFPFRGQKPPSTTESEYENMKLGGKFRCRVFYLANEDDFREYAAIRDKCANGLYAPVDRDRIWDEKTGNYRVYLEWVELGYDLPPTVGIGAKDAVREYTDKAENSVTLPYSKLAGVNKDSAGW